MERFDAEYAEATSGDASIHDIDQEIVVKNMTHKVPSRDFQYEELIIDYIKKSWSAALDPPRLLYRPHPNLGPSHFSMTHKLPGWDFSQTTIRS